MTSKRIIVGIAAPARRFACGLLATLALLCGPWQAVRADVALYQATVPLQGTTAADRNAAFGEALKMAAVRASGRPEAATAPRVVAAAAQPEAYIQQYSTTADRMLKVGFDGRAMEQLLQQAGLPLWPAERPLTLVLLFVPGVADGARAVNATEHPPERVELERAALARGVPLAWPVESLDPAAARARLAGPGPVLTGLGSAGGYDWSFAHAGQSARTRGALAAGADLAADALAARYAPASTRSLGTVTVRIGGLADLAAYAALTVYLDGLSLVHAVTVRELAGDTVQFDLEVRGDLELLRRIFALDSRLVAAPPAAPPATNAPDFLWQP
ncbi:MAG TPA: DUF2066 domain-containing protein [Steroidobacteraceae bacterium]